jgi:hypothetical protein
VQDRSNNCASAKGSLSRRVLLRRYAPKARGSRRRLLQALVPLPVVGGALAASSYGYGYGYPAYGYGYARLTATGPVTATQLTVTAMGPVTATPRRIVTGPVTVTLPPTALAMGPVTGMLQLTALAMGPVTGMLRLTALAMGEVTEAPITPLSDALSMPSLMVFAVIGSKSRREHR